MNAYEQYLQMLTRRHFLTRCGVGLGGMALSTMLGGALRAEDRGAANPLAPRKPHFAPKAKNVIYLHMAEMNSPPFPLHAPMHAPNKPLCAV